MRDAHMVDVDAKQATARRAVARACVNLQKETFARLSSKDLPNDDVLAAARWHRTSRICEISGRSSRRVGIGAITGVIGAITGMIPALHHAPLRVRGGRARVPIQESRKIRPRNAPSQTPTCNAFDAHVSSSVAPSLLL
jgi:hypothetical protein